MKKKYVVELDDNEVLIKYTIEKRCMDDFLGRTAQLANFVCNPPGGPETEEGKRELAEAMIEDSVYTALNERGIESTYEVIASPIKVEKYINGDYEENVSMYLGKKVQQIVDEFFGKREMWKKEDSEEVALGVYKQDDGEDE